MPSEIHLSTANQAGHFAAMRSAGALNDVVFVCKEGRRANAHRLALVAVSELAHDLFDSHVDVVSIFLPDFSVESVEGLLDLIYRGECAVEDEEQIQEIVHLISILRLKTPLNCNLNLEKEPNSRSPRNKGPGPKSSPLILPMANRKRTLPLEISQEVAKRLVLTPISPTKSILSTGGRSSGNRVTFHRGAALTNVLTIPPRDQTQSAVKRKLDFDPAEEEDSVRVTRSAAKNPDGLENGEKEKVDTAERTEELGEDRTEKPGTPEKVKSEKAEPEKKVDNPIESPVKLKSEKAEPGRKIKCLRCSKIISEQSRAHGFRKHLALKHYSAVCRRFLEVSMEDAGGGAFREFFSCTLCDLATADSSAALLHVACIHRSEFDSLLALEDFTVMHGLDVDAIKSGPALKLHKVRRGDKQDQTVANHTDHVQPGQGSPIQGGGSCVICGQTYAHNLKMHLLSHFWRMIVADYGLKDADGCCPICHNKMSTSGYAFEYHVAFRHKKIGELLRFNNAATILHDEKD